MSLTIDSPQVERTLRDEAERRGISAAQYAADILATHLEPGPRSDDAPFYATASAEDWMKAFDAWIDSHPRREPLPASAISRESFYL